MRGVHDQATQTLQEKVAELTDRFLRGKQPDFLKQHSRALDDYFEQAFEKSMIGPRLEINKNPYVIIALGGYGREEQCIYSDIDLLFLFGKRIPPEAESLIREMIYPLWDIGMVGLSLGGSALSVIGIVIALKRIARGSRRVARTIR